MALILPHTDLEGAYVIAERVRMAIEAMEVPLLEGGGSLRITASVGAAVLADGQKDELIAAADNALYVAKRDGKNRTVRAKPDTANVVGGRVGFACMGLLDDAIREHLDLKRRRGADPTEVERAEREALGPVRRNPRSRGRPDGGGVEPIGDGGLAYDQADDESWRMDSLRGADGRRRARARL